MRGESRFEDIPEMTENDSENRSEEDNPNPEFRKTHLL